MKTSHAGYISCTASLRAVPSIAMRVCVRDCLRDGEEPCVCVCVCLLDRELTTIEDRDGEREGDGEMER